MAVEGHIARGDTIAGYEVEELVGRGGMGEIYRARDPRLERRVGLATAGEVRLYPTLERDEAELVEPRGRRTQHVAVGEVGERVPAP
jgi:serine/threonine-protein kinase